MASEHIIHIPRIDNDGTFVVLRAVSNGPEPLDLRVEGSEGEGPYCQFLKQKKINDLRAKNYQGSDEDWVSTLESVLLQNEDSRIDEQLVKDLEVVASVKSEKQLDVVFRRNIGGITQRLGTLELKYDPDLELDPFGWAITAATSAATARQQLADLTMKLESQKETIHTLNRQLEELIESKHLHETMLLNKFRDLLNSKKLKIRDQQRLLAGAQVDAEKAKKINGFRTSTHPHQAQPSRHGKRKANGRNQDSDSSLSDENEFERMSTPKPLDQSEEMDDPEERVVTPDRSELSDTDDEFEGERVSPQRSKDKEPGVGRKDQTLDTIIGVTSKSADEARSPPPRRTLPFSQTERSGTSKKGAADDGEEEGEETAGETDDDEL